MASDAIIATAPMTTRPHGPPAQTRVAQRGEDEQDREC